MPANRDTMRLPSNRISRPNRSSPLRCCANGAASLKSPLETARPKREQTPGSKNLRRTGKYVLRSDLFHAGVFAPLRGIFGM